MTPHPNGQRHELEGDGVLRTEPLKAFVIGAVVRGPSMRDVESLCEPAGLGKLSKTTASTMGEGLKQRFDPGGHGEPGLAPFFVR
jgi:hypothetical protein